MFYCIVVHSGVHVSKYLNCGKLKQKGIWVVTFGTPYIILSKYLTGGY